MKVTVGEIYYSILAALFVQMLFFPKIYMAVKGICVLMAIMFFLYIHKNHIKIKSGKTLLLIYLALNVISTIIGIGRGYGAYAIRTGTVNIVWPACFFLLMDTRFEKRQVVWLYKAIIRITFILCVWDIAFMFCKNEWIHNLTIRLNRGIPHFSVFSSWYLRVDHLYFYAFLMPFMMGAFLNSDTELLRKINVSKGFIGLTLILSILITIWSGMGGLWLASAVGVFICFFRYRLFQRRSVWILIIISGLFVILFLVRSYSNKGIMYQIMEEISSKFVFDNSVSEKMNSVRTNQAKAMIASWLKSPIWGQGIGYPVRYYRSEKYVIQAENELQYLAILYQRGILGFFSFFSIVAYAIHILNVRKDIKWFCNAFMVGMLSFLTANIFNPYLVNLSTMWILFFPFFLNKKPE